jgi:uncharacterized protein
MENKKFDLSNRLYVPLLIIAVEAMVCAGIFTFMVVSGMQGNITPQEITVSGEGKASVTPDIAVTTLGVTTEGKTSEETVSQNDKKMNEIIKEIGALGIDKKDIKTTNYNLYPKYTYTDNNGSYIDGYTLSQEITLKIRNFEKVGDVIQKATSLGANTISQLQFTVDNPDAAKNEAMTQAIEKAKAKATAMATSSGLKLGSLVNVYEGGSSGSPVPMYGIAEKSSDSGMGGGVAPAPDIQVGEQEIVVTMNLVYRIK